MRGLAADFLAWPYAEGLTVRESMNDLAFRAIGMYGKALPSGNDMPSHMVLPGKYGLRSSTAGVEPRGQRSETFWEGLPADDDRFWANVSRAVPHPASRPAKHGGVFVAGLSVAEQNDRMFA